jgi:aldehyde:ferredoxin oxidoreductase
MNQEYSLLAEFNYNLVGVERGYTNRTLYINLSDNTIHSKPVTNTMKDIFIGGRGFGLWLLWHGIRDDTQWDDPENEIVISSGPIGGITQYPGSGKSIVVTVSPTTQCAVDSNVGGHFGPYLKFAGWDAIEVQGKAEQDVIVFVDGVKGKVSILETPIETVDTHILAEELLEMFADSETEKRNISSVTAGLGADHTLIGCLNVSLYDPRRQHIRIKQAGRGGTGTVFRDKKIKALVVKSPPVKGDSNQPADLERITRVGRTMNKEVYQQDPLQNSMRTKGTTMLVDIIDYNDLLPVNNFQYGSHPETPKIAGDFWEKRFAQNLPDGCWYGCTVSCSHTAEGYLVKTGPYQGQRSYVDGPEYETIAAVGSNCGIFDPEAILELNFYCDTYGIDTISFGTLAAFIMECYEAGILNEDRTGGLELNFGNAEASIELLHRMGRGQGFGRTAGLGIRRMKKIFAKEYAADPQFLQDIGMEAKGMEYSEYITKESLAQQGGYGLANKGAQHDEALHYFPMFRTWFGLNGLCKLPWNDVEPADNRKLYSGMQAAKVPEHVQNYVDLFVGVTGRSEVKSGEDLVRMSEAVYNFQRVFNLRLGFGTREHDAIPYRSVGPVTAREYESRQERYDKQLQDLVGFDPTGKTTLEKMAALRKYREAQYEKLVDAVYKRRGWTSRGVPRLETLKRLKVDFPEVVKVVQQANGE